MEARHYSQTPLRVQCKTLSIIDAVIDGRFNAQKPVGASLLAMVVNDDACFLETNVALKFIASKLAPTARLSPS
jgi:hypothetical protein